MNLENYTSFDIAYDYHNWGKANVIETMEEYNELSSFFFGLGVLKLTNKGHLKKNIILSQGAVESKLNNISYNSHEFIAVYAGRMYRFVFKPSKIDQKTGEKVEEKLTGLDALRLIKKEAKAAGIDMEKYAMPLETAIKIKHDIPKAWIKFNPYLGNIETKLKTTGLKNAYHIDINSAYPAGLCVRYPEFRPIYEKHYRLRKENEEHKCILNYSIGAFQSLKLKSCNAKYALLSKAAIEWTINRLNYLTAQLEDNGFVVLAYNTDGIWFAGGNIENVHRIPGEGTELGQWKLDHVAEIIRFKSPGAYEYIENGVYHPVIRGRTRLDAVKPRNEWKWGDIFQNPVIVYGWDSEQHKLVELDGERLGEKDEEI